MKREVYISAVACALAETPVEFRRAVWQGVEEAFRVAYKRDHPCATDDQVEDAWLTLARAVSERMALR